MLRTRKIWFVIFALYSIFDINAQTKQKTVSVDNGSFINLSSPNSELLSVAFLVAVIAIFLAICTIISSFFLKKRIDLQNKELEDKVQALEDAEDKLTAILEAMPDIIFTFDTEAHFVSCRANKNATLAYPPSEFLGKAVKDVFKSTEAHANCLRMIRKVLSGYGPQIVEYSLDNSNLRFEARFVYLNSKQVLCVVRDITTKYLISEKLESSLAEKEALLREIHHRVKNNMQIISSLLNMQSAIAKDNFDKDLFLESQSRIVAMATVHDELYKSVDFSSVYASDYIKDLIDNLEIAWPKMETSIRFVNDIDNTVLSLDEAIPVGLIINELITNSYKYAFKEMKTGVISLKVKTTDNIKEFTVADNGIGLPPGFSLEEDKKTMGYTIISALISQLKGQISIDDDVKKGTSLTFSFSSFK